MPLPFERSALRLPLAALTLALLLPATASAARIDPGLWEFSVEHLQADGELGQAMAEMRRQMESMPPEARRMMEEMLGSQGMGIDASGAIRLRVCITPEDLADGEFPTEVEDCRYDFIERQADRMRTRIECTDEGRTRGEGDIRILGRREWKGRFEVESRIDGRPTRMTIEQHARWIGNDCTGAMGRR
jgi:hypothetical protein